MMVTLEIPAPERITTDQKRKGFFRSLLELVREGVTRVRKRGGSQ